MRRHLPLGLALAIGFVVGAAAISMFDDRPGDASDGAEAPSTTRWPSSTGEGPSTPDEPTTSTAPTTSAPATSTLAPADDVLLVWTSGGLPPGLADATDDLPTVHHLSTVRGEELGLTATTDATGVEGERHLDGWTVPIDAFAVVPEAHAAFLDGDDAAALEALGPGEALLSTTAARLRSVDAGATLRFGDQSVTVVDIVADRAAAGAEIIVDTATGRDLGIEVDRFLLLRHTGDRQAVQDATVAALDTLGTAVPVRFRSPAETTWLRHGDAVLPLALIKDRFGEFATRDTTGRGVEIEPGWIDDNIEVAVVPVIGEVRCHRAMLPALESALRELVDRDLAHLVDADQFAGCFVPRRIAAGQSLSRHSWGIAIDLNVGDNPRGSFSTQDARLVDIMRSAGFGWGGAWLVPDPAHYEVIEPAAIAPSGENP